MSPNVISNYSWYDEVRTWQHFPSIPVKTEYDELNHEKTLGQPNLTVILPTIRPVFFQYANAIKNRKNKLLQSKDI